MENRLSGNWGGAVHNRLVMEGNPTFLALAVFRCNSALIRMSENEIMRRRRKLLLFFAAGVVVVATFVRMGYKSLGWGGYVHIDIAAPWKR